MLIKKHDKSYIVELDDGSLWRIWPGDIALTLNWLPTTDLLVSDIGDEFCSHALIDQADGSRVRVIEASEDWPVEHVRRFHEGRLIPRGTEPIGWPSIRPHCAGAA
jgi:hypothetical protein